MSEVSAFSKWYKEAEIEEAHAILVIGVPATTEVASIEDAVQTVKVFGRVCVKDSKLGPIPGTLLVLCECCEVVDPARIPTELLRPDGEESWKIVVAPVDVSASEFSKKLSKFLTDEGKSMTDIQALFSPHSSSTPESIIRAVG